MSDDDPCPSCGIPYDLLPIGHDLITPMDGSPQTCEVLRGVSPLTYARDFPPAPTGPCLGTYVTPTKPLPVTNEPQEIPEAFRRRRR